MRVEALARICKRFARCHERSAVEQPPLRAVLQHAWYGSCLFQRDFFTPVQRSAGKMNLFVAYLLLLLAATLEAGGDALVRIGLHSPSLAGRAGLFAAGAIVLFAYGVAVNSPPWDFGKLLGVYVTLFFLVAQLINLIVFGIRPDLPIYAGGALILSGGLLITLWRPESALPQLEQVRHFDERIARRAQLLDDVGKRHRGLRRIGAAMHVQNDNAARADMGDDIGDNRRRIFLETVAALDVAVDDRVILGFDALDVIGIEAQSGEAEVFLVGSRVFLQQRIGPLHFGAFVRFLHRRKAVARRAEAAVRIAVVAELEQRILRQLFGDLGIGFDPQAGKKQSRRNILALQHRDDIGIVPVWDLDALELVAHFQRHVGIEGQRHDLLRRDGMIEASIDTMIDAAINSAIDAMIGTMIEAMVGGLPRQPRKKRRRKRWGNADGGERHRNKVVRDSHCHAEERCDPSRPKLKSRL